MELVKTVAGALDLFWAFIMFVGVVYKDESIQESYTNLLWFSGFWFIVAFSGMLLIFF